MSTWRSRTRSVSDPAGLDRLDSFLERDRPRDQVLVGGGSGAVFDDMEVAHKIPGRRGWNSWPLANGTRFRADLALRLFKASGFRAVVIALGVLSIRAKGFKWVT